MGARNVVIDFGSELRGMVRKHDEAAGRHIYPVTTHFLIQ